MIVKKVSFTQSQLQQASGIAKDVPAVFSIFDTQNQNSIWYRPKLMYVNNGSGGPIGVCPMTDLEYGVYSLSGAAFSDYFPVANSASGTFDNLKRTTSKVVVSGAANASSGLNVYFEYE